MNLLRLIFKREQPSPSPPNQLRGCSDRVTWEGFYPKGKKRRQDMKKLLITLALATFSITCAAQTVSRSIGPDGSQSYWDMRSGQWIGSWSGGQSQSWRSNPNYRPQYRSYGYQSQWDDSYRLGQRAGAGIGRLLRAFSSDD